MGCFETFHEGTEHVKQSNITTVIQQFKLFHMKDGKTIYSMKMRFTRIVNKLQDLWKTVSNQNCSNKVLRCMSRECRSKVTTIKESQNLKTLGITTLFGKTKKHEHEILRLKVREEDIKKKEKNFIALKSTSTCII